MHPNPPEASAPFESELVEHIVTFLRSIGIPVEPRSLPDDTFLPGIEVEHGRLFVDEGKLQFPGDLLHEAGHLAVLSPQEREGTSGDDVGDDGAEIAAIAWSWAALVHLDLDPTVVFHNAGYRGSSQNLIQIYQEGRLYGQSLLTYYGMTEFAMPGCEPIGEVVFPAMKTWLRMTETVATNV